MLYIGRKVVCTDIKPGRLACVRHNFRTVFPVVGRVYTIRKIFDARPYGHDDLGLLLEEVRNPVREYMAATRKMVRVEQFWLAYRFRPLRRTNIDVFKAMLAPQPVRVDLIGWKTERIESRPILPGRAHLRLKTIGGAGSSTAGTPLAPRWARQNAWEGR
jgi:hypothetical protein